MRRFVAVVSLLPFVLLTLPAIAVQALAQRRGWGLARTLPGWWHRRALAALRVRVRVTGRPVADRPLLVTPNHCSWLDIPVIGSLAPLSFVAKSEVASWPLFGLLARLQRTVFVDRTRRHATGSAASELAGRLGDGDAMVLFPEGTSGRGDEVLPFRSALLGAARSAIVDGGHARVMVQPLVLAYTRLAGRPIDGDDRLRVSWVGDDPLVPHLWGVATAGGVEVEVIWGEPVPFDETTDRKALAAALEARVRTRLLAALDRPEPALEPVA